jgi:hypothetical protein
VKYKKVEQLDLYVRRVEELLDTRLVTSGDLRSSFTIQGAVDAPVSLDIHQPDEENLRSFLLTYRQFVSDDEPIFANRIANVLWVSLDGDSLRGHLEQARARFKDTFRTGAISLTLNEHEMSPERAFDLWINGRYFHSDTRKARTLDALDPVATTFVRHIFLDALVEGTKYFRFLADVILIARRDGLL